MKSCPTSVVASLAATLLSALVTTGCASSIQPRAALEVPPTRPLAERLVAEGLARAAFVTYLDECVADAAWDGDDARRGACAAAFELRGHAEEGELARWRDVAAEVCAGATTPMAIAVCRGVAELTLSGPLEDHRRARDALTRGCHVHGDYAACLRLVALGATIRVAGLAGGGAPGG